MCEPVEDVLISRFKAVDPHESGCIPIERLEEMLGQMGFSADEVVRMVCSSNAGSQSFVRYAPFIRWVFGNNSAQSLVNADGGRWLDGAATQLLDIAASISDIACTVGLSYPHVATKLASHATSLRAMLPNSERSCDTRLAEAPLLSPAPGPSTHAGKAVCVASPQPIGPFEQLKELRCVTSGHRQAAAELMEKTGPRGTLVDDLVEISVEDLVDQHAISHCRMCHGLRLYRSESVTKALRLICAGPVPGLNGPSYLEVFRTLTTCSSWRHHVFLFGGLVRDILRRIAGNDVDINFSASAKELAKICQENGYVHQLGFGDEYLCIGDDASEEKIEGFAVTHNPPQGFKADFSFNQLYYDFCNDVIIDKFGNGVPSVAANLCELPCPRSEWDAWLEANGPRVLFRYYKFLLRGHSYSDESLAYVGRKLLHRWATAAEEDELFAIGRYALGKLVSTSNVKELESLRELVFRSFDLAMASRVEGTSFRQRTTDDAVPSDQDGNRAAILLSARAWWNWGWMRLLKLQEPAGHPISER